MPLVYAGILILFFGGAVSANTTDHLAPMPDSAKIEADIFYDDIEVMSVIDGDTLIAGNDRIRLWGIDAPEKGEPHYETAKMALKHFAGGRVSCKHIDIDRYQRNVMQCETEDGVDIGSMLVWTGMAEDFTKYSGGFYRTEEKWAKKQKLGIWKD